MHACMCMCTCMGTRFTTNVLFLSLFLFRFVSKVCVVALDASVMKRMKGRKEGKEWKEEEEEEEEEENFAHTIHHANQISLHDISYFYKIFYYIQVPVCTFLFPYYYLVFDLTCW